MQKQEWLGTFTSKSRTPIKNTTDFVFTSTTKVPVGVISLYNKLRLEFSKILSVVGLDQRKEGMQRRRITLHSFRRFAKTTISDQAGKDYSEWFLGHSKSPYYTKKEPERRKIYADKCMKYLTFLDYTTLEATGKSIEGKLVEKDLQIQTLQTQMEEIKRQPKGADVEEMQDLKGQLRELTKKLYEAGILKKD